MPEIQEIHGGHRLHHVDLFDQQFLDFDNPFHTRYRGRNLPLVHAVAFKHSSDGGQFMDDLFKPQLIDLVHDDE